MARISLRAYNRDIEVMIDKNQIDEAFAHCRYILELYPKHIDTYRLMGKALLEAQRFSDASDVFHRVLSSAPDDFIAHLGMSIIREDESNLDAAIWHMERSFEVQPSNAAVQVELRRLYGLRDGVTPQKIQLTRGALARMSAKSNLHSQAIAELRSALSNDPQRPDLQVVLAEMYLQTGSRMEAIETCNALINKLPYCLNANRILAEVLPETERADQAHEYKTRLGELDPYYLQLSPVAPTLEQVPDGAVTIERFEFTGESFETVAEDQPAWAASLGVDIDDEQTETDEATPDWLEESESETAPGSDFETDAEPKEDEGPELVSDKGETGEIDEIPDWMSEIDDSGAKAAPVPDLEVELPAEDDEEIDKSQPLDQAVQEMEEVPDWIGEVDETEEQDDSATIPGITAAAGAAALGAVIAGHEDEQEETDPEAEIEPEEAISDEEADAETLPEWMASVGTDGDQLIAEEADDITEEPTAPDQEILGDEETDSATPKDTEEMPDWMTEGEPGTGDETPDWLRDAMDSPEDEQESLPVAAGIAAGAAILSDDDTLEQIEEAELDLEGETPPTTESEPEAVEAVEIADLAADEDIPEETADEDLPEEAGLAAGEAALAGAALAGAALGASLDEDDETSPELVDEAAIPHVGEEISEVDEDIPDWLQDLGEDLPTGEETEEPPVVFEDHPADEEPTLEPDMDTSAEDAEEVVMPETPAAEDQELIPEGLAIQGVEVYEEGEFPESIPDWLSEVSPDEIPEEVAEAEAELGIVRAEIPIWLRKMEDQHRAELEAAEEVDRVEDLELDAEFTELSGEDVPSWLMSAMEPELPPEGEEPAAVDDISEVFKTEEPVEIDELGLVSSAVEDIEAEDLEEAAEDLELIELEDELAPQDVTPEAQIKTEEPADETIEEFTDQDDDHLEIEPEAELVIEEIAEEIVPDEALEAEVFEDEQEGIGLPGLAAAGAAGVAAAHLLDDEDTQPIAVTDEPEVPDELDTETIFEEPIVEGIGDLAEVGDYTEEQVLQPEEEIAPQIESEETEAPAFAAEAPLSGEEEDAAMAWLESLAAKQGAAEEELLTPTDERLEQPPDWVQEEASEGEIAEDEDAEVRDTALTAAALAGVTAGILAGDEEHEEDEMEAVAEVGEPLEESSEWVPEILAEEEQVPEAEIETASEEIIVEPEPVEIEEEPGVVEEVAAAAEVDLDQVEADETPEEIPDWLSGLAEEQEAAAETDVTEWTPDMLAEDVEEPAAPVEGPPAEKLDLNVASLAQLEKIPGMGFIFAQNIVNHRAESGSFTDLEQLGEVEGLTPDLIADLGEYLTVEVVTEASTTESEIPELQQAWDSIADGNIEEAIGQYTELIDQDQHLDEIIRELQAALSKYPSDSALYQCLGDAYMHTNMLQEALDAYNRAEDLII